jgi:hypothetical protein
MTQLMTTLDRENVALMLPVVFHEDFSGIFLEFLFKNVSLSQVVFLFFYIYVVFKHRQYKPML